MSQNQVLHISEINSFHRLCRWTPKHIPGLLLKFLHVAAMKDVEPCHITVFKHAFFKTKL